jgi:hypothetical protein
MLVAFYSLSPTGPPYGYTPLALSHFFFLSFSRPFPRPACRPGRLHDRARRRVIVTDAPSGASANGSPLQNSANWVRENRTGHRLLDLGPPHSYACALWFLSRKTKSNFGKNCAKKNLGTPFPRFATSAKGSCTWAVTVRQRGEIRLPAQTPRPVRPLRGSRSRRSRKWSASSPSGSRPRREHWHAGNRHRFDLSH